VQCIVTWSEGEEVHYLFVEEGEIAEILEEDKEYIVAYLPN